MAIQKKTKTKTKKQPAKAKAKKSVSRKTAAPAAKKKVAKKKPAPKKPVAKKKAVPKKPAPKKKPAKKIQPRGKSQASAAIDDIDVDRNERRAKTGGQSGDLQGLSNRAGADSESVDELLEEGNSFEAGIVQGIEDAPDPDESEIFTHEVLEDDVPGEYLDED